LVQLHVDVFDGKKVAVLFRQVYGSDHVFDSSVETVLWMPLEAETFKSRRTFELRVGS
jgi:hypothetical protein